MIDEAHQLFSSALSRSNEWAWRQDRTIVWRAGQALSRAALLGDARALAARLPERRFSLNTCGDRYNFLVALLAAVLREQVTLLSGDRSHGAVTALTARYPDLYELTDMVTRRTGSEVAQPIVVDARGEQPTNDVEWGTIPADRLTAIVFTSGTTGTPTPHGKRWGALRVNARLCAEYMHLRNLEPGACPSIVATVPPQHMYGFEASILAALHEGVAVYSGQPLLPAEVGAALASMPAPRLLVTTPYHLRALARARMPLSPLAAVISATAPLTASLAGRAEEMFSTRVIEIYGFTEAGMVATRRTVEGDAWHCHPDIRLHADGGCCVVQAEHLDTAVPIPDVVRLISPASFVLCSRGSDIVDIAGKRASLSGLNTILTEIDGVIDGAFFQPRQRDVEAVSRLVAIVVAPNTSARTIRQALRRQIDAAFLPRRIVHVDQLPRSAAGKLTHNALGELARQLGAVPEC